MSKRGFHEVLAYVEREGGTHYNDVARYAIGNRLVESRASVTIILNALTKMGLLQRIVLDSRPVRTEYRSTTKGSAILHLLEQMDKEISPRRAAGRGGDTSVSEEQKAAKVKEISQALRKKEEEELEGRQRV